MSDDAIPDHGRFDLAEIGKSFPATADTLLIDRYLTNEAAASARVFRVYRGTPPHYHAMCDEYPRGQCHVLQGPHAALLHDIATPSTALARIHLAIRWIRQHFIEPLRVEALAAMAAMSPSAFHHHLKSATALSPVRFEKRIRLLQARLLLVSGGLKASDVAFDVGYESATQFSREYARYFGAPPAKDAARISSHLQQPGSAEVAA